MGGEVYSEIVLKHGNEREGGTEVDNVERGLNVSGVGVEKERSNWKGVKAGVKSSVRGYIRRGEGEGGESYLLVEKRNES